MIESAGGADPRRSREGFARGGPDRGRAEDDGPATRTRSAAPARPRHVDGGHARAFRSRAVARRSCSTTRSSIRAPRRTRRTCSSRWARQDTRRSSPGKPSKPPLGGINLGISSYSEHSQEAFDAAACLVQPENQMTAAKLGGLPPTDATTSTTRRAIKDAYPGFSGLIKESIDNAAPRPQTPAYTDLSLGIQRALHPIGSTVDPERPQGRLRQAARLRRPGRQAGGAAVRREDERGVRREDERVS